MNKFDSKKILNKLLNLAQKEGVLMSENAFQQSKNNITVLKMKKKNFY